MQFHAVTRLKNFIEKSKIDVAVVVEKSGIPPATFYRMLKKEDILMSSIDKVLKVINVDRERFLNLKTNNNNNNVEDDGGADAENENVQLRQIINLLKKQIDQNEEVIALLKKRK